LNELSGQIRDELVKIKQIKGTRQNNTCSHIRSLFRDFDLEYDKEQEDQFDWTHEQQEPRDVLNMLLRVFDIAPDVSVLVNGNKRKYYFNSAMVSSFDLYQANEPVLMKNYFPIHHDTATAITTFESATFVCFDIDRNFNNKKVKTRFVFTPTIKLRNGNNLHLSAIIMHHGSSANSGHYTCMIKDGSKKSEQAWFHHDDLKDSPEYIGSFKHVLENGFVAQNCVLLVYS
jgi:hypothetical protein